jgi:hypothetical protein
MDSGGPLALLVTGPVDRRTQTGSETWGWDGSSWRARDRRLPPP